MGDGMQKQGTTISKGDGCGRVGRIFHDTGDACREKSVERTLFDEEEELLYNVDWLSDKDDEEL